MPEISFNYLGQTGHATDGVGHTDTDPTGAIRSPRSDRPYLLEVNGSVNAGRLEFDWWYSEAVHRPDTVEGLADRFAGWLRAVVAACSPGVAAPDFSSRGRVSDEDLTRLLSRLDGGQAP